MRLSHATDTRVLIAGVAASLALLVYLTVAFLHTHAGITRAAGVNKDVPWNSFNSKLVPIRRRGKAYDLRVLPANPAGPGAANYGAIVQTVVLDPVPGERYVIGLWLRGKPNGPVGFELNEFRPGVAKYPIQTTVPVTRRWHHYTFSTHIKGTWIGLAVVVLRQNERPRTWFEVRPPTGVARGR